MAAACDEAPSGGTKDVTLHGVGRTHAQAAHRGALHTGAVGAMIASLPSAAEFRRALATPETLAADGVLGLTERLQGRSLKFGSARRSAASMVDWAVSARAAAK